MSFAVAFGILAAIFILVGFVVAFVSRPRFLPGREPTQTEPEGSGFYKASEYDFPGFAIAKYRATDGQLDASFHHDGKLVVPFINSPSGPYPPPADETASVHSMAIDPQGRLRLVGEHSLFQPNTANVRSLAMVWLKPDGTIDKKFPLRAMPQDFHLVPAWPSYEWWSSINFTNFFGQAVRYGPSLDIYVSGAKDLRPLSSHPGFMTEPVLALLRFDEQFNIDTSFGAQGMAIADVPGNWEGFISSVVHANGSIAAAGWSDDQYSAGQPFGHTHNFTDMLVAHLPANGKFTPADTSILKLTQEPFQGSGPIPWFVSFGDIIADRQGRTIVVGARWGLAEPVAGQWVAARFDANGKLDPNFGSGGIARIDIPTPTGGLASCVAIDSRERIVIGGWLGSQAPFRKSHVIRLMPDGSRDKQFGTGGASTVSLGVNIANWICDLAIDSQDRIVVAGMIEGRQPRTVRNFLVDRFLPDGQKDPNFSTQLTKFGSTLDSAPACVIVDPQDDIYVGGRAFNP